MINLKTLGVVSFLLIAAPFVHAQSEPAAEAALKEYGLALKAYDTRKMADMMHPEAVQLMRATMLKAFHGSNKDAAAAQLLPLFSVASVAEFEKLPSSEIYKRLNDYVGKASPDLLTMMSSSSYEIVGSVLKEGLAYVTYNLKISTKGKDFGSQEVQKLKLHEGKWMLLLPTSSEQSIKAIETQFP